MVRHVSLDDPRVGQRKGNSFKPSGTKDHPQRIAFIPSEAFSYQLVPSEALKQRAHRKDSAELYQRAERGDSRAAALIADMEAASTELDDINRLSEIVEKRIKSNPPSAEIWTNEKGQKVVLHPDLIHQEVVWVKDVGPVIYRPEVPQELWGRTPENNYGFVVLVYELDNEGNVARLSPDRAIDLGNGHKLDFKYELKPWTINDPKANAWKEHSRRNPVIFTDYDVYEIDKDTGYPKLKFTPAGSALWRQDSEVMKRIIRESRKIYADLPKNMAKDFSTEELIELFEKGSPGSSRGSSSSPATPASLVNVNLSELLGVGVSETPAIENTPSDIMVDATVESSNTQDDFDGLLPPEGETASDEAMNHLFR